MIAPEDRAHAGDDRAHGDRDRLAEDESRQEHDDHDAALESAGAGVDELHRATITLSILDAWVPGRPRSVISNVRKPTLSD